MARAITVIAQHFRIAGVSFRMRSTGFQHLNNITCCSFVSRIVCMHMHCTTEHCNQPDTYIQLAVLCVRRSGFVCLFLFFISSRNTYASTEILWSCTLLLSEIIYLHGLWFCEKKVQRFWQWLSNWHVFISHKCCATLFYWWLDFDVDCEQVASQFTFVSHLCR